MAHIMHTRQWRAQANFTAKFTHLAHTAESKVSFVHTALGQHSADLLEHAWCVRVVEEDNVCCSIQEAEL
jgi:hypothetical protein